MKCVLLLYLTNIQVLAIQEHKLMIKDSNEQFIRRKLPLGWWFIFSSATLTSNNVPVGGFGFLLFPTAYKSICSINLIWFKFYFLNCCSIFLKHQNLLHISLNHILAITNLIVILNVLTPLFQKINFDLLI